MRIIMTLEQKQLLIADLCGRVPYDTVVSTDGDNEVYLRSVDTFGYVEVADYKNENVFDIENVKPYLRPMSSMTDEEREEYDEWHLELESGRIKDWKNADYIDWLNAHHFDYRGLIEKGLALEAHEGIYNLN